MELMFKRCAGLDVHQHSVVACTRIVEDSKVTEEVRTFETTTKGLLELSGWLEEQGCSHVAMEATGVYWKPVWHVLEPSFELVLANAAHIKNVPGRKTDVNDATWIADLLAHGLIRGSFVPPTPVQDLRALMRTRKQLVREAAASGGDTDQGHLPARSISSPQVTRRVHEGGHRRRGLDAHGRFSHAHYRHRVSRPWRRLPRSS